MMAAGYKKNGELLATHISVEWKFFLEEEFGTFSSPGFEYLGAKWCIDLYMEHGFFELYIYKTHEAALSWGDWAYYIIGIKDIDGAIYKCESGKKKVGAADGLGRTKQFLRPSDLRRDKTRIAPEGVLVVFCDLTHKENHWMRMMRNAAVPTEIAHQSDASTEVILEYLHRAEVSGEEAKLLDAQGTYKLSGDLQNLLLNGTHFDTTIKVSGREFRAHRCILGARSPVFEAMFAHDSVEHNTGIVEIQDCDPDTFEDFLCFLYSGKVTLSSENVVSLYALADKYDVPDVKVKCVNFMVDNLCVDNFCTFITLALEHNEQKMLKSASDFFAKNTKKIILSAKWHCFFTQYPVETNELFIKAIDHHGQG